MTTPLPPIPGKEIADNVDWNDQWFSWMNQLYYFLAKSSSDGGGVLPVRSSITTTAPITGGGAIENTPNIGLSPNGITNSFLALMPPNTIKGNLTGSNGPAADVTTSALKALFSFSFADITGNIATTQLPTVSQMKAFLNYIFSDIGGTVAFSQLPTAQQFWQVLNPRTSSEIAAGVTPTNYQYLPGDIRRYGAGSQISDNGPIINAALSCNQIVFDGETSGPTIYQIQTTIRFQAAGQTFRGAGFGDSNTATGAGTAYAPRTTIRWAGISGGSVFSTSNRGITGVSSPTCFSETVLRDVLLDGNQLAQYGVEGFDDSLTSISGCWRNQYINVGVTNCTIGNGIAIYQGNWNAIAGRPFANDNYLSNCYLWNCLYGIGGVMAVPQLHHCTIGNMNIGIRMRGLGSEVKIYGGVLHSNQYDIVTDGICQNLTSVGTWFENSTQYIYLQEGANTLHMLGCHLHTSSTIGMFNFTGQAGSAVIKCWAAAGAGSYKILGTNPQYDYDFVGSGLVTDNGYSLRVTQSGGIAKIDNAKFTCFLSGNTSNITGDGTQFNLNATAVLIDYDLSGSLNTNGVFTAPVTAQYRFTGALELTGVSSAHTDAQFMVVVTGTSAATYLLQRINPGANLVAGSSETRVQGSATVPMTKGDTAYLSIIVSGSTKVVGVLSGGPTTNWRNIFSGQIA